MPFPLAHHGLVAKWHIAQRVMDDTRLGVTGAAPTQAALAPVVLRSDGVPARTVQCGAPPAQHRRFPAHVGGEDRLIRDSRRMQMAASTSAPERPSNLRLGHSADKAASCGIELSSASATVRADKPNSDEGAPR